MQTITSKVNEAIAFLRSKNINNPQVAVVLGTGLGQLVNAIEVTLEIDYTDIPHFVTSTVEFHKGKLIVGTIGTTQVIAMQGRFHYYEGYSMQQITFPIRVFKALGVQQLILSNAAGGMNVEFKKGDLVALTDHINMLPESPLRGVHEPAFGDRFVDLCNPYNAAINENIIAIAASQNVVVKQGVYVAVQGPYLETKAEYKYLAAAGADMVGMSTVPEVIVANQIGLPCVAISVITDECNPATLQPVNIAEIIAVAGSADVKLSAVLAAYITQLA